MTTTTATTRDDEVVHGGYAGWHFDAACYQERRYGRNRCNVAEDYDAGAA
jgi:hypothetical protein